MRLPRSIVDRLDHVPESSADLFAWAGLVLHSSCSGGRLAVQDRATKGGTRLFHLHLVIESAAHRSASIDNQLELPLQRASNDSKVVQFLTRSRRQYLDYFVRDILTKIPNLLQMRDRLSARGIVFVGDLVQLRHKQASMMLGSTNATEEIARLLSAGGRGFGMHIPYWIRPISRIG